MYKRFSISILGRIVALVLQLGIIALLGRGLGVFDFGILSAAMSLTLTCMAFAELGMGVRVLRSSSDIDAAGVLGTFLIVRTVVLVVVPVAAFLLALTSASSVILIVAGAVYAAGEATGDFAVGVLQGSKRSGVAAVILVGRRALLILLLVCAPSPDLIPFAVMLSAAVSVGIFLVVTIKRATRPTSLFRLVRQNLAIIFSGGASNLAQLDVAIVTLALGPVNGGLYASAVRLFNPLNVATATLMQVFIPELASANGDQARRRVFRSTRKWIVLLATLPLIAAFLAPWVVQLIFGEEYASAAPVAVAVFVAASLSAVAQVHTAWFYSREVPRLLPAAMWIATAFGLASLWLLSTTYGLVGAAIGLVIFHLGLLLGVFVVFRKFFVMEQGAQG